VLDRVATSIWELERGVVSPYAGGRDKGAYTAFVTERLRRGERARAEYERYAAERERRKAVIAELRTHGSHNYAQVRSREKQLAKFTVSEAPPMEKSAIGVRLRATRRATSGIALTASRLAKAYAAPVFSDVSFE